MQSASCTSSEVDNLSRAQLPSRESQAARTLKNIKFREETQSHLCSNAPKFTYMARTGGNMASSTVSETWTIEVALDGNNLAMWEPNDRYRQLLVDVAEMVETLGVEPETHGLVHPFLNIARVHFDESMRDRMATLLFGHCARPKKALGQFLCSIGIRSKTARKQVGIRSKTAHKQVTWTFDPEAYNRVGYRITPGGDRKGGKPFIVFTRPSVGSP
jgi:hypothetical protein